MSGFDPWMTIAGARRKVHAAESDTGTVHAACCIHGKSFRRKPQDIILILMISLTL